MAWLRVGCPVLSFQMFDEADSNLMPLTVAVGACASANLLTLFRGRFGCFAKVFARLHVGCAVYDSCVIVRRRIDQMVEFSTIRVDYGNIR